MTSVAIRVFAVALSSVLLAACSSSELPQIAPLVAPGECGDHTPYRNAYFGDLHVHTAYSFDAYLFGNHVNDPQIAYDFAKGERIRLNDSAR